MIEQGQKRLNPLEEGIKVIGIGKHGSKSLADDLLNRIIAYLLTDQANALQKGAFFGALATKGIAANEYALEQVLGEGILAQPAALFDVISPDSPPAMRPIGIKLLAGDTLSVDEAQQLGDFLFSDQSGETYRGMAASVLRIRYETDEEYQGLMKAAEATFAQGFREPVTHQQPVIQLAEPFDGVEHSYLITPILAHTFQQMGCTVLLMASRTSGPKYTLNVFDVCNALDIKDLKSNADLLQPPQRYGWVLDTQDLSAGLDAWVDRRRKIMKRPFLATLEKVLNPSSAHILITSVFHITYMEKMVELAKMAGFKGVIVLKRGLEGTLAPSISRASGILCAARQADGSFITRQIEATEEAFQSYRAETDEVVAGVTAQQNAALIEQYIGDGATGNPDFDQRAGLSIALYSAGLAWIRKQWEV